MGVKNVSVIKKCLLLGGSLTKIATFVTKHFVRYSSHVFYLGCPLLGGFPVHCARLIEGLRVHAQSRLRAYCAFNWVYPKQGNRVSGLTY